MKHIIKFGLVILVILLTLLVVSCVRPGFELPPEPPSVVWTSIGDGIGITAVCEDNVICYRWSGSMSCMREFQLAKKYCDNNTGEVINGGKK